MTALTISPQGSDDDDFNASRQGDEKREVAADCLDV